MPRNDLFGRYRLSVRKTLTGAFREGDESLLLSACRFLISVPGRCRRWKRRLCAIAARAGISQALLWAGIAVIVSAASALFLRVSDVGPDLTPWKH